MPTVLYVFLLPRDLNPGPLAARRLFQEVIKYFSKCNEKYFKYTYLVFNSSLIVYKEIMKIISRHSQKIKSSKLNF